MFLYAVNPGEFTIFNEGGDRMVTTSGPMAAITALKMIESERGTPWVNDGWFARLNDELMVGRQKALRPDIYS